MAELRDLRNNEWYDNLDQLTNQTITDARTVSGSLAALNDAVTVELNGHSIVAFDERTSGVPTMQWVWEGSFDGTNFFRLPVFTLADSTVPANVGGFVVLRLSTITFQGAHIAHVAGYRAVRCRCSSFTGGGSLTVTARASRAPNHIYNRPLPSLLNVSIAPAVNTGGTITLPAVAGMFHYITAIECTVAMNPATARTGAASVFITSTNIPGTPAWVIPISGNAAGSTGGLAAAYIDPIEISFPEPVRSTVLNTATTLVFPAPGAGAQLRANCQYYLGAN